MGAVIWMAWPLWVSVRMAETMPSLTVCSSSWGLPMTTTRSPTSGTSRQTVKKLGDPPGISTWHKARSACLVHGQDRGHGVGLAVAGLDLGVGHALDDMVVGDEVPLAVNEKAAAGAGKLALFVIPHDGDHRREGELDELDQIRGAADRGGQRRAGGALRRRGRSELAGWAEAVGRAGRAAAPPRRGPGRAPGLSGPCRPAPGP